MNKAFTTILIIVLIIVGIIVLTKKDKMAEVSEPVAVSYSDGATTVDASFDNTNETVTFTHESVGTVTLPRAISASGARYANEDESIVFWEHQGEATITVNGTDVFRGAIEASQTVEETEGIPAGSLLGEWAWEKTVASDSSITTPNQADKFTLTFTQEGRVHGTTDCNNFNGSYQTDGAATLSFGPLASTLMFCEGSQETVFTSALSGTESYYFNESGHLILYGESEMHFMR